jgi:pantetheine-phosphate adenylyltransferase
MIAVYPGSFDPATMGHVDIIRRAAKVTDRLIVAVLGNPSKTPVFSVEERVEHLKEITKDMPTVLTASFTGLLVDYVKEIKADVIIRGLRALTDFEYEFQMALTNRELNRDVETLLIPTSVHYQFLSSSVVKEVAMFGGEYKRMVPEVVLNALQEKYGKV